MFNDIWNHVTGSNNPYAQYANPRNSDAAQQQANYTAVLKQATQQYKKPQWVFAGQELTLVEFALAVYGDTPQGLAFILKHSQGE